MQNAGIPFQRQQVFPLYYKGEPIGGYIADLVVANIPKIKWFSTLFRRNNRKTSFYFRFGWVKPLSFRYTIILELKSVQALNPAMTSQLLNYMRLAKVQVGYLMNFNAVKLEYKRYVIQGG